MKRIISLLLVSVLLYSCTTTGDRMSEDTTPVPYEKEEFPKWSRDLRRSEIILLGSLPLVFMLSNLAYDNMGDQIFPDYSELSSSEETRRKITIAVSISGVITLMDYVLGYFDKEMDEE